MKSVYRFGGMPVSMESDCGVDVKVAFPHWGNAKYHVKTKTCPSKSQQAIHLLALNLYWTKVWLATLMLDALSFVPLCQNLISPSY